MCSLSKQNEEESTLNDVIVNSTVKFLWKAGDAAINDESLMRDIMHAINDASPSVNRANIVCSKCGVLRHPSNCKHRLKSKAKCGKAIQRALKHQRKSNAKVSRTLTKKFVNSKSMLLIHCKVCQHTDQISGISRADIFELRRKAKKCGNTGQTRNMTPVSLQKAVPSTKQGSIESFLNKSLNRTRDPIPRSKKKKSHLSQLLADEASVTPSSSLMDFLSSIPQ